MNTQIVTASKANIEVDSDSDDEKPSTLIVQDSKDVGMLHQKSSKFSAIPEANTDYEASTQNKVRTPFKLDI